MSETVQEAGGVVIRQEGPRPLFLLVRSSDGKNWLFPKGHIESGETADLAALREVREETGIEAAVRAPLGRVQYRLGGTLIDVIFYLMEFTGFSKAQENRELRWCDYPEARDLLSFEETKQIADEAFAVIGKSV